MATDEDKMVNFANNIISTVTISVQNATGIVALCMLYVRNIQFNVSELFFVWNLRKFEPANVLLNSLLQFLCVLFQVAL